MAPPDEAHGADDTRLQDQLSRGQQVDAKDPGAVHGKAQVDGIIKEKLGPEALWLQLAPPWAGDRRIC